MGLEFFQAAVRHQLRYGAGLAFQNTIQTNGLLLNDAWCRFLREHRFLVGLSLDGPRALHDAYRVDREGMGSFRRVREAARLLRLHGVAFNVLTAVHAANAGHPLEVYRFLRDAVGASFIQFIPVVERVPAGTWRDAVGEISLAPWSVSADAFGAFLVSVFDEWVRRDVGRVFVQAFDVALANWVGSPPGLCVHSPTCGTALALEHNGDLYSCDHFVAPSFRLGNILETPLKRLAACSLQRAFGLGKQRGLPRCCLACDVRFACHGECPRNRFLTSTDGEGGLNYLCSGYRAFFRHIRGPMHVMAELLRQGRPPAEVMTRPALKAGSLGRPLGEIRRNDPCPCGSGKKFKRCHGRG
jgi:uncharacterized protein